MGKVDNIHDKIFKKVFSEKKNVKAFMKVSLPEEVKNNIDFNNIEIDPNEYITTEMRGYFTDIIVKTRIRGEKKEKGKEKGEIIPTDIYLLFEHKSYQSEKILFQLLRYMYMMWEKDIKEGKKLRVILPFVFYHGRGKWKVKREFNEIFNIPEGIKRYTLNYRYMLFDANEWDLKDMENKELRKNIVLLSMLILMKSGKRGDIDSIERVIELWREMGVVGKEEYVRVFLTYIMETKDIKEEKLIKIIEEKKIGGEIMPTLANRLREEGYNKGIQEGIEKGIYEDKKKVAKNMLMRGLDEELVSEVTGLSEKEVKEIRKEIKKN